MSRLQYDEMVRHPGKFEGESAYVPYFWDKLMDGAFDDEFYDGDIPIAVFYPSDEDKELFPEIDAAVILVWEDDNGFVRSGEYDSESEFQEEREALEREDFTEE